jgi:hypothetical protein
MAKENRLSVRLPDELAARLEAEAARQRRTVADLARLTLADNLPPAETTNAIAERRSAEQPEAA